MKMHSQSESHVRRMLVVGEDPKKVINEYSNQFIKDFLQLLKTGHGSKQVQMNHFYQEYIANKVRNFVQSQPIDGPNHRI